MKDIHNHPLFTDITPEEEVSVQGGKFGWNLWWKLFTYSFNSLYEYHKRTDPYRDSNGRLIAR